MSSPQYLRSKAEAFKITKFLIVQGTSYRGKAVKRDGKRVTCGHKHRTRAAAEKCRAVMRATRPGRCQAYHIAEIEVHHIKKAKV